MTRMRATGKDMVQALFELALASWSEELDVAWIHCLGRVQDGWAEDAGSDASEGSGDADAHECVGRLLARFNPGTRIVWIHDHPLHRPLGDVKYTWSTRGEAECVDVRCTVRSKFVALFRRPTPEEKDDDDAPLTAALLTLLKTDERRYACDVFALATDLGAVLARKGATLGVATSHNLTRDAAFL